MTELRKKLKSLVFKNDGTPRSRKEIMELTKKETCREYRNI